MSESTPHRTGKERGNYAVIFTSRLKHPSEGYQEMAERMLERVSCQPGFIDAISFRNAEGYGVTISYWRDPESIQRWREDTEHQVARKLGKREWYADYQIQVCRIERAYDWSDAIGQT